LHMQGYLGKRIEPGNQKSVGEKLNDIDYITVEEETVEEFDTVVGTVLSRKETYLSAQISALVKEILVYPGKKVVAGNVLIRLDDQRLKTELARTQSAYESASARKDLAEKAYLREKNLLETGSTTQARFETARAEFEMATAQVKESAKNIDHINVQLGYAEIKAPFSGIIVEKLVEEGTLATPGKPLLKLEDPENLRLEVYVPESRSNTIEIGKSLFVRIDTLRKDILGKVDEIVPSSDPKSRSFLVRLTLEHDPEIRSGMFGRCYLPIDERKMILVDEGVIYRVGQLEMVKVLSDKGLEARLVRLGNQQSGKYEVLSGLEPGERVARNIGEF
ncbi:efflux RND transporter periplasmic adaptor subunit, partial [bacterium]|nr:efflux RND transporter periplasmic adaptor subunit [candidate division CSSED10-310 bacterium]